MSIPFEWLTVRTGDFNAPLIWDPLIRTGRYRHQVEYCWGLRKHELKEHSTCNSIKLHSSMKALGRKWMLVPTRQTLRAMLQMQEYNLDCPPNQRKHYLQEFNAKEYEYMFVPTGELPELVITLPNGKIVPLMVSKGRFPWFTSSANPWAICHKAKTNILLCDVSIRCLDWALALVRLTDKWRSFTPPAVPNELQSPKHDTSGKHEASTTDEDAIQVVESSFNYKPKYDKCLSWLSTCADASDCEPDTDNPMNEQGDEDKFFYTAQKQPAWYSDSTKGREMRRWGWGAGFT